MTRTHKDNVGVEWDVTPEQVQDGGWVVRIHPHGSSFGGLYVREPDCNDVSDADTGKVVVFESEEQASDAGLTNVHLGMTGDPRWPV